MNEHTKKAFSYILKKAVLLLIICVIGFLAFNIAFNHSRVRVFVNDAMTDRAAVILQHGDVETMQKYFDTSFMEKDMASTDSAYKYYNITKYDYEMEINSVSVGWIAPRSATVTVSEYVTDIKGQFTGTEEEKIGKSDNPPDWQPAKYRIKMKKQNGRWYIFSIDKVKDLKAKL